MLVPRELRTWRPATRPPLTDPHFRGPERRGRSGPLPHRDPERKGYARVPAADSVLESTGQRRRAGSRPRPGRLRRQEVLGVVPARGSGWGAGGVGVEDVG